MRYRHLGVLVQGGEKQCWASGPYRDQHWNSWVLSSKWEEAILPGWALERPGARLPVGGDKHHLGKEDVRDWEAGKHTPLLLALTLQVTSAPPLLCQTEGGSWVLMGLAVRGSRELFAAIGPEEAWISGTVGEAHFLPPNGFPYWLPEGSDLCPPDPAGSSGSSPRAAALFLLLLTPLVQGW